MFTLTIKTDNAGFAEHPELTVARLLRQVAYRVEEGETSGKLRDSSNGPPVGSFKLDKS